MLNDAYTGTTVPSNADTEQVLLKKIAAALTDGGNGGSGGGGSATPVTLNGPFLLGASATKSIPAGAKGYLISVITGTATINGNAGIPVGNIADPNTQAVGFDVVTDASSSAVVSWNT